MAVKYPVADRSFFSSVTAKRNVHTLAWFASTLLHCALIALQQNSSYTTTIHVHCSFNRRDNAAATASVNEINPLLFDQLIDGCVSLANNHVCTVCHVRAAITLERQSTLWWKVGGIIPKLTPDQQRNEWRLELCHNRQMPINKFYILTEQLARGRVCLWFLRVSFSRLLLLLLLLWTIPKRYSHSIIETLTVYSLLLFLSVLLLNDCE